MFYLKAIGVNIFRATAVRKAVNDDKAAHERGLSGQILTPSLLGIVTILFNIGVGKY